MSEYDSNDEYDNISNSNNELHSSHSDSDSETCDYYHSHVARRDAKVSSDPTLIPFRMHGMISPASTWLASLSPHDITVAFQIYIYYCFQHFNTTNVVEGIYPWKNAAPRDWNGFDTKHITAGEMIQHINEIGS